MGDDNRCSTVGYGITKDFAGMSEHAIECPDGDSTLGDKSLATIERQANAVLLLLTSNIGKPGQNIFLSAEGLDVFYKIPTRELKRGKEFPGCSDTYPFEGGKFFEIEIIRTFSEYFLYLACQIANIAAVTAAPDNDL